MDISPLTTAPSPVPLHAYLAIGSFVLGCVQFLLPKGGLGHKWRGRVWMLCMAVVAFSGFFINEIRMFGPFSPIHLLSAYALFALWYGLRAAQKGNIRAHKTTMISIFFGALVIAGAFTLLPGRIMFQVFFG